MPSLRPIAISLKPSCKAAKSVSVRSNPLARELSPPIAIVREGSAGWSKRFPVPLTLPVKSISLPVKIISLLPASILVAIARSFAASKVTFPLSASPADRISPSIVRLPALLIALTSPPELEIVLVAIFPEAAIATLPPPESNSPLAATFPALLVKEILPPAVAILLVASSDWEAIATLPPSESSSPLAATFPALLVKVILPPAVAILLVASSDWEAIVTLPPPESSSPATVTAPVLLVALMSPPAVVMLPVITSPEADKMAGPPAVAIFPIKIPLFVGAGVPLKLAFSTSRAGGTLLGLARLLTPARRITDGLLLKISISGSEPASAISG